MGTGQEHPAFVGEPLMPMVRLEMGSKRRSYPWALIRLPPDPVWACTWLIHAAGARHTPENMLVTTTQRGPGLKA